MKTLVFIVLVSFATVATAHDSQVKEREWQILKNRVTCLVSNQRFMVDYMKCQKSCKELQRYNKNHRCSCELWDTAIKYCG